jgi:hypothetical protein
MPPQNDLVAATVAAHRSVLLHSTSGSITQLAGVRSPFRQETLAAALCPRMQ